MAKCAVSQPRIPFPPTVRLPLAHDSLAQAVKTFPIPAEQRAAVLRVMVVDDNADAAQMLGTILQMKGHTVALAFNGLQALQVANDFAPQIASLDIGMPGMNGYEAALALAKCPARRKSS